METPRLFSDILSILASLRDIFRQRESANAQNHPAEDEYRRGVLDALHQIESEVKGRSDANKKRHGLEKKKFVWERIGIVIAAVSMVAVIYYAFTARAQLDAQVIANKVARESFESSERGRIFVRIKEYYIAQREDVFTARVFLKNAGRGPAFGIQYGIRCSLDKTIPDVALGPPSELALPGQEESNEDKLKCFMADERAALAVALRNKRWLYVWVLVKYRDTFRDDRETRQCWVYRPDDIADFRPCPIGMNIFR